MQKLINGFYNFLQLIFTWIRKHCACVYKWWSES